MKLMIDGVPAEAMTGESLLDILRRQGRITGKLSTEPLAAKIAGEVFYFELYSPSA